MLLDELARFAMQRAEQAKTSVPLEKMRDMALALPKGDFCFEKTLRQPHLSFICEVKRASPSKGMIAEEFPYLKIAADYADAGADCVSCLTEPKWFLGSDAIFRDIRKEITLPMLRKDFTVDAYQLYEAKCMGADAVLLICALLNTQTIAQYLAICEQLGLSALVEAHDAGEIDSAVSAGARIVGVNNRNLKNFSVNLENAARLREKIPSGTIFVAESGIHTAEDVALLHGAGADAVLIGEALMKAADKSAKLAEFRRAAQ